MGNYEFNGEKYKKASKHQKEWGNKLISELRLKGDEIILDLGCGDGVLTQQLAERVPKGKVIGIDASINMIQTAKKCWRSNLEFIHMDINVINFYEKFDVIFSNAALHWVKDHERLLKKAFAALKLGGVILWDFAGKGNCSNFFEVVRCKMNDNEFKEFFCDFEWPWFMPSKSYYEQLVTSIGFSQVDIVEENRDRYFTNADEMIKWIDQPSIIPFITCIPREKKELFRQEIIDMMLEKTQKLDGTCFETFRRIHICAQK